MAAIERGLVNLRFGDGHDFNLMNLPHRPNENAIEKFKGKPKFGGGDVSSEPKSPPPTKLRSLFFDEWLSLHSDLDSSDSASDSDGERPVAIHCPRCTCQQPPEYVPTVKIGSFHVPKFMEAFVDKMIGSYLDNTNSVLVTDLSFDVVSNSDLAELCRPYGNVTSADVAIDQESGLTWFFGFVSFATRDDAQNAINNLDGVQWLTPKTTS